jgi:hypothetical protein
MRRFADLAVLATLIAVGSRGQAPVQPHSPQEPDPHENSVEQNAPAGDRDSPAAEPPASQRIPDVPKPASAAPQGVKPQQATKPLPSTDSEEAILGRWELVPVKSHFAPDATPPMEVRTYVKTPDGIQATVTTTGTDGTVHSMSYPWRVDGKEYPVKGSPLLDSIVLKHIDNLTAEATLKHGDKVLASERREFSADGETMTITVQDMTAEHPVLSKAVYKKVASTPK